MGQAPAHFGRYQVLRELSRGGMGVIHVAADPHLGREVALKVLLEPQADPALAQRFEREARALAALKHPAIVAIYDQGVHDGRPFMAMELVPGESLEARLRREGPLPPLEAARLIEEVARAIEHAHRAGILHRDIKPANVLIDPSGRPKVVDFGLARTQDGALTRTGEVLGTAAFMAPEQASGERHEVGPATDVYGLGATLYALLTGVPPFAGASLMNVLKAILTDPPRDPRRLRPEVSSELAVICLRCLAKEPQQRYASAGALADELGRQLAPPSAQRGTAQRPRPRSPVGLALLALAATACVVLVAQRLATPPNPDHASPAPATATAQPEGSPSPARLHGTWQGLPSTLPSERDCALAPAGALGVFVHGGRSGERFLGDTATWRDGAWTPSGEGAPGERHGHALAYDPRHERVLLSGGIVGKERRSDLWAWSCTEGIWTRLDGEDQPRPPERAYHGLVCDPKTGAVLLFGGQRSGPALGDLWEWTEGGGWRRRSDDPEAAQYVGGVAWDALRERLVVYGGKRESRADTALHEWDGERWEHFPLDDAGPGPRTRARLAFDGQRTIAFGGRAPGDVLLADAWAWDGQRWTPIEVTSSDAPSPRSDHGMAFDPDRGRVVVFGGSGVQDQRVWELTITESGSPR